MPPASRRAPPRAADRRCAALVRVLRQAHVAPLLSMAVAEAAAAVVCEPGSRTTEQSTLEAIVQVGGVFLRPAEAAFPGRCGRWNTGGVEQSSRCHLPPLTLVPSLPFPFPWPSSPSVPPRPPPQEAAALGSPLFSLFSHPAPRVAHAAALIMRAVAEGGAEAAQPMRGAALTGERLGWAGLGWA